MLSLNYENQSIALKTLCFYITHTPGRPSLMHKLPNDLLILHNHATTYSPLYSLPFRHLIQRNYRYLSVEINLTYLNLGWKKSSLCIWYVFYALGIFFLQGRIFGLLPNFPQFCCQRMTELLS